MKKRLRFFAPAAIFLCSALCAGSAFSATPKASGDKQNKTTVYAEDLILSDNASAFDKDQFFMQLQEALGTSVEAALSLYDTVPDAYKDDFDLQFLKAALYVSISKFNEAKAICAELSKKDPENADVIMLSATIAKAQGNAAERTKQLKALLDIDSGNVEANIGMADDEFSKKKYKPARQYYLKALAREPDNQEALFGQGRSSYYLEYDSEAERVFKKIIEKDPSYAPAYAYLGKLAGAHDEYYVASGYAKKAIQLEPNNYDYLLDYGMYENGMNHFENAEKAWSRAIELKPDYFLAYTYRAGLYDESNMFEKALSDYEMVIKLNPNYYFAYESMGTIYFLQESWTKAREAFTKCFEKNNANISYPLLITFCYYKEKKPQEAKKFSDSVLRKLDRSSIEYAMLRVYHDQGGEMPLPKKIAAIKNSNTRGKMYFYLGLLYDMYGGKEASRQYYSEVLKLNSPLFFEYKIAAWSMGLQNLGKN